MKLRFAFQGGGAKLAAMIAVADGIFESCQNLDIEIEKLAGSSAGAIAATILATGLRPRLFAYRLKDIGPKYEREIFRTKSVWGGMLLAALGVPILNRSVYSNFLHDLFNIDGKSFQRFSDLALPVDIVATDLVKRTKHVYDGKSDDALIDALLDSSAIPFFLHTHRDRNDYVDGGLVNNLPIQSLVTANTSLDNHTYAVAVTFYDDAKRQKSTSLGSYVLSLVSTVIDYNVAQSLTLQKGVKIHTVYVKTGLLDFSAAIKDDLSDANFEQQRVNIIKLIGDIQEEDNRYVETLPIREFAKRLQDLQLGVSRNALPNAARIVYRWTCYSLRERSKKISDTCKVEFDLSVDDGLCWSYSGRYSVAEAFSDIGNVNVVVKDAEGKAVPCTVFPLTPELLKGGSEQDNLFIFFHKPLRPGDMYTVQYEFLASEVLFDLSTTGQDFIEFAARSTKRCEEVTLLAFVPDWVGDVELLPIAQVDGPDPTIIEGKALTKPDLDLLGTCPVGFRPIGWSTAGVMQGFKTGFAARVPLFDKQ